MAPQSDLCKVGKEGFNMIDEYLNRKRRQGRLNEKHNTPAKKEPMLDSIQAARQFNGTLKKEPMLDSIQAARQFNGTLFVRYYPAGNIYRRFN